MGTMTFLLPDNLPPEVRQELPRACIAGGPDNMPTPTEITLSGNQMRTRRDVDESGFLVAPWLVDGVGLVTGTTATLMERVRPYNLLTELARGKVNQTRCQAADWKAGGLQVSPQLDAALREATLAFGRAAVQATGGPPTAEETDLGQQALTLGYRAADILVHAYVEQVFQIRHQRSAKLDTTLGCRLSPGVDGQPPTGPMASALTLACNAISIPFSWHLIEAQEGHYTWEPHDRLVKWALDQKLSLVGGPLVDFSAAQLPSWLWMWEKDVTALNSFLCKYVEAVIRRYRQHMRRWQLNIASNSAKLLGLSEEEFLGLTYRMADAARQVDPTLELVLGVAQPWGEYLATEDRVHSPFIFTDTLIRSGLTNLSALDVELVMGVRPRGSNCRDLLDTSRILDLYALLGLPIRVTLGYPAAEGTDPEADPDLLVGAGRWQGGGTPEVQADWAADFAALTLCKPYVQAVQWVQHSDTQPHQFPHMGLFDAEGKPRPVLERLRKLREAHLH